MNRADLFAADRPPAPPCPRCGGAHVGVSCPAQVDDLDDNHRPDTCQNCDAELATDGEVVEGRCADCSYIAYQEREDEAAR